MATLIRRGGDDAISHAHPRIARRRLRVERSRRRRNRPLILLIVLTVAAAAAIAFAASPLADVDRIVVEGASHTGDSAVLAASGCRPAIRSSR